MQNERQQIITWDFIEYVLNRPNDTGSFVLEELLYYNINSNIFEKRTAEYSHAVLKVIDEIISNAVEVLVTPKCGKNFIYGKPGTELRITVADTITVRNDGPGYEIRLMEDGIYTVQKCIASQYTSSNYNDNIASNGTGTNGLGSKLTNIHSKWLEITTVCAEQKIKYYQKFENNMRKIHEPVITKYTGAPYTEITFLLDFDGLCRKVRTEKNNNWIQSGDNAELMKKLVLRRSYEASVYMSAFKPLKVVFNDLNITCDLEKFVSMHVKSAQDNYCVTTLNIPLITNNRDNIELQQFFQIGVIIHEPVTRVMKNNNKFMSAGGDTISILNGGTLSEVSNYVKELFRKMETYIANHKEYILMGGQTTSTGGLPVQMFANNITFISIGSYDKRAFSYKNQAKTAAEFNKNSLAEFKKLELDAKFLAKVWKNLKNILPKLIKIKNTNNLKAKIKLYEPAKKAKTSQAEALFVVEGNSAATLIRKIIEKNPRLSRDEYGIYSIQGVPMNAIKNSTIYPVDNLTKVKQNEALMKNDGLQALVNVLGLNYEKTTKPRYRHIILATDQDCDGIGKICSLLICFFVLYFPDLVKSGFIKRFRTPIIRATYRGKRLDFYDDSEFENFNSALKKEGKELKGDYFKGLGTHDKEDVEKMAQEFFKNLIQVTYDIKGDELMYHLYDTATFYRKEILKNFTTRGQYENELMVTMHEHFTLESIPEQINNIHRMTPNAIDGLTPAQRKTLATFRHNNSVIKVSALCGEVISKMNYAHGEASLEGVITRMAQIFVGANKFPLILPVSDSNGTQFAGKKDTASARYTKIRSNPITRLYYPLADDDILEYVSEEGGVYEPKCYIPIVPRAILEDFKAIATGWNCLHLARRFDFVMKYLRISIEFDKPYCSDLIGKPELYPGMQCVVINNKEYILGSYELTENSVIVTQLPVGMWGVKFMETAKKLDQVESVDNESGEKLRIAINLKTTVANILLQIKKDLAENNILAEKYPIIYYFGIYKIYTENLNFFTYSLCKHKEALKEYSNLDELFCDWYYARRECYKTRIEKMIVRHKALLELKECVWHFLKTDKGQIDDLEDEEREYILKTTKFENRTGYTPLNAAAITNIRNCNAQQLSEEIYNSKNSNYDYIYNLKKSQTSKVYIEKLKQEIEKLKLVQMPDWQSLWLQELDELEKQLKHAKSINWFYKNM